MRLLMSWYSGCAGSSRASTFCQALRACVLVAVLQGADAQIPPDLGIVGLQTSGLGQQLVGLIADLRQAGVGCGPGRPARSA